MSAQVLGIGAVGGFGCGAAALAEGTARAQDRVLAWAEGSRTIQAFQADLEPLDRFIPRRALRRVDRFSRLALLGAHLALEDAGLAGADQSGLGLILGSGHGATGTTYALIESMIQEGDACASPIHFAGSLHNTPAAHLSILLGAKGPSLTLCLDQRLFPEVLRAARLWLAAGRTERLLVGVVDELSELMAYLWARRWPEGHPQGLLPGEGALFLLLGREDAAGPGRISLDAFESLAVADGSPFGEMPGADAFTRAQAALRSSRR